MNQNLSTIASVWVAAEISFLSKKKYNTNSQFSVRLDAVFTHTESGDTLKVPAFWNGENEFAVRFAPTRIGSWSFVTQCEEDDTLNGIGGSVNATEYEGELDIYKHGFIKTDGRKCFVYADGTPFFFLGDTHWSLFCEEIDEAGPNAGEAKTDSHFKYIVDRRAEQGFTVYESEPINAPFANDLRNGVFTEATVDAFKKADRYFQYIAQKGLVHANAQFFFANDLSDTLAENKQFLEAISRYWVARYAAYPVMWTLGQEVDDDMYHNRYYLNGEKYPAMWLNYNNPWIDVAEYLHRYDPYGQPLSGHQECFDCTTVTGKGTTQHEVYSGPGHGASMFLYKNVSDRTGHNWWAAQWRPKVNLLPLNDSAEDYWESSKVSINYESRYCCLWTKQSGARIAAWVSFLSGFFGYGYGAIDIWLYQSTFDIENTSFDGVEYIYPADKQLPWSVAVNFESAYQCGYMRKFFEDFQWWEMVPDLGKQKQFIPDEGACYANAAIGNDTYIVYLFNTDMAAGTLVGLADKGKEYTVSWFDPRSGRFEGNKQIIKADTEGKYHMDKKPDTKDWVMYVTKNG